MVKLRCFVFVTFSMILAGAVACGDRPAAQNAASRNSNDRPLYYTRPINRDDLNGRTLRELSLMRNTIYARAGNKFRKKWLNDYFSAQPWYRPLDKIDEAKVTALDRRNAEVIAKFDADTSRDWLLGIQQNLRGPTKRVANDDGAWDEVPLGPEDQIERRLVSIRLGQWAGSADQERTPLEDPSLLDQQITVDSLKDFSRRDLRLLRNLIYARRGRPFHSELIKTYFAAVDWYKPDPKYTDARLTALDKRNINLILSLENSLGGPLTDWEHKKEDGWFAQG
jgi:hypothetical protein